MKRLLVLLFLIAPLLSTAQVGFDTEKLDSFLSLLEENNKALSSVAISKGNKLIYEKHSGFLSPANKQRFNSTTKFRIGSISKTFTAAVIFQLIEEGKLAIDTKLNTFYPDFTNGDKITIAHLLSHQSGIHNYTDETDFVNYMANYKSKEEMLGILKTMSSDFEPGSNTSYSNSGYFLLGLIIEKLTDKDYKENVQSRIIDKLNLEHTSYGDKIENDKNEATSMVMQGDWTVYPIEWDMSTAYAAGALVSTPSDLNKFMHALFNNQLVSEASVTKMKETIRGLGHGVFPIAAINQRGYGHNGHIDTFDAGSYYLANDDLNVTLITTGLTMGYNDILIGVLSIMLNQPYEFPDFSQKPITLSQEQLSSFEGEFTSDALPLKITVSINDGQLTAQATGQGAFPLTTYSETECRFDGAGIVMLFSEKVDEKYIAFTLKQGGQIYPYKRVSK